MTRIRIASLALLAAVAAPVQAADDGRGHSVESAIEKVVAKAERLDSNRDGWLTEDETSKGRKTLGMLYDRVADRVDANGDGRIAVEEYVQAQVQEIRRADENADGWIGPDEERAQKRRLIGELLGGR